VSKVFLRLFPGKEPETDPQSAGSPSDFLAVFSTLERHQAADLSPHADPSRNTVDTNESFREFAGCCGADIPAREQAMFRWILSSLLLGACASSTILPPLRKPDGSWHLKCGATLDNCVKQAEDLCSGRGYVVLSGLSKRSLYGAELGVSRYEVREAELDIACADRRGNLPTVQYSAPAPSGPTTVVAPAVVAPATPVLAPAAAPVATPVPPATVAPLPPPAAPLPVAPPAAGPAPAQTPAAAPLPAPAPAGAPAKTP